MVLGMDNIFRESGWNIKGGTLSDKSARKEFGLTQKEIIKAINGGKLQYQYNHIYGNPYIRLLRSEVEALVAEKHGSDYLEKKKLKKELLLVKGDLKKLQAQMALLEKRKIELQESLSE
jgi:DNA mismatch repair ATPase MutS